MVKMMGHFVYAISDMIDWVVYMVRAMSALQMISCMYSFQSLVLKDTNNLC